MQMLDVGDTRVRSLRSSGSLQGETHNCMKTDKTLRIPAKRRHALEQYIETKLSVDVVVGRCGSGLDERGFVDEAARCFFKPQ